MLMRLEPRPRPKRWFLRPPAPILVLLLLLATCLATSEPMAGLPAANGGRVLRGSRLVRGHSKKHAGASPVHRINPIPGSHGTGKGNHPGAAPTAPQPEGGHVVREPNGDVVTLVDESTVHGKQYRDAIEETNEEIMEQEEQFLDWLSENGQDCRDPLGKHQQGDGQEQAQSAAGQCPTNRALYAPDVLLAIRRNELRIEDLPVCNVTVERAVTEGMFVYRGEDYAKPYDHTCWVQKYRYHVSDRCPSAKFALYRWQWTLRSAYEGKCRMPSTRPRDVARLYRAAHPEVDARLKRENRPMRIALLGISFVREEFEAYACMHEADITDGRFEVQLSKNKEDTRVASLEEVRRGGGTCHGLENTTKAYAELYPPEMNGGVQYRPPQNFYYCGDSSGALVYDGELEVCYVYTSGPGNFAKRRNLAWNKCGFPATSVDAWIGTYSVTEFQESYFPAHKDLAPLAPPSVVISVKRMFMALIREQLARAYCCYNVSPAPQHAEDFRAQPLNCNDRDIHMPMPGAPDYAAQIWLSVLATGMNSRFEG